MAAIEMCPDDEALGSRGSPQGADFRQGPSTTRPALAAFVEEVFTPFDSDGPQQQELP